MEELPSIHRDDSSDSACQYLMGRLWLTFVVRQFSYDPGWFVGIKAYIQDVTESL